MKRSDIAIVLLIAAVSVGIAFFIAQTVLGNLTGETQKVKTIERIETSIEEPNTSIFNQDAINPAVEVQVGAGSE
jgi:uncharacterized protein YabE (DUF348 family)